MRVVWLSVAIAGCIPYRAGTIERETHAEVQQLGCLEIGVLIGERAEAAGPVLVVHLGNRCDHSIAVDLAALCVRGGNAHGASLVMTAYDPAHEIGARRMDARMSGEEWIEYNAFEPISELTWLDVDLGGVVPDVPHGEHWVRLVIPRPS